MRRRGTIHRSAKHLYAHATGVLIVIIFIMGPEGGGGGGGGVRTPRTPSLDPPLGSVSVTRIRRPLSVSADFLGYPNHMMHGYRKPPYHQRELALGGYERLPDIRGDPA